MSCNCGESQSPELQESFQELLKKYKGTKGSLIPLLQEAQEIYGYLPKEAMQQISRTLNIPFSKTYGVVTFYSQFHLKPRGRNIIRVCQGTACHVRGATKVFDAVSKKIKVAKNETTKDLRYTLETVACLGACGLAPVMMVNEDTHGRLTPDKAGGIIEKYE
jgi:NADH-quinone oxidoreductase subunit E